MLRSLSLSGACGYLARKLAQLAQMKPGACRVDQVAEFATIHAEGRRA
jgi:hypothetical protein